MLGLFKTKYPDYKICTREDGKFCALYNIGLYGYKYYYVPIMINNTLGTADRHLNSTWDRDIWVDTEEDAGSRINTHSTRKGLKTVWKSD